MFFKLFIVEYSTWSRIIDTVILRLRSINDIADSFELCHIEGIIVCSFSHTKHA